jgi:hypothetical protein
MSGGRPTQRRLWICALALGFCLGCGGNGPPLPTTYKVTGSVIFKSGKPATGGAIQFSPVADTTFTVSGDLQNDGTFSLTTFRGNERVSGAPEGEYRVTILLPLPADQKAIPGIVLPNTYRVEAKDNNFAFEIAPPAGRP